jgi:hypothetical protein
MTTRIAMWSGPRNISTAMMRSFGNRPDCAVVDEPFYAAYLHATGLDHPMRAEVLASQPHDPDVVARRLVEEMPDGKPIYYQKHMTHHMIGSFDLGWMAQCRNVFLIRTPARVVASYARKRQQATLADLGFSRQAELFARECDRLGSAPPVIDADDVLANPRCALAKLCDELKIPFSERMLNWPPGRRASDGVWAAHWYEAVERSTGFEAPQTQTDAVDALLVQQALPYYARMHGFRLGV